VLAAGELGAVYRDGALELNIPYDEAMGRNGQLKIEVVDPSDKQVGTRSIPTSSSRDHGAWRITVPIDKGIAVGDLAWDRLRLEAGEYSRVVSLSEILRLPIIRIFAQRSYAAGSPAAIRVITADSRNGNPLAGSKVKVSLADGSSSTTLFSGSTDGMGTVRAGLTMPAEYGPRQLLVTADTLLGSVTAKEPIQLERLDRILLSTDKPIYRPGQTMHLRALALNSQSRAAEFNQPITIEVEDGKGNKVFKKRGSTDRFGIASADFELADEVNFGPYHVRAIVGDDVAKAVQEKTVTVDRYVLPKFKIDVELGKDGAKEQSSYYRPGDTVEGKIVAHYIFGKPLTGAEVSLKLTTFDVQSVEIAQVTGRTDREGRFSFSSKLPDFMAGRSTEQGSAPVAIGVEVKDSAGHAESKSRNILVSNTPIIIMAVPESGSLLPGLENRVYLLTSYPDGAPAETTITVSNLARTLKTDSSGVAILPVAAANTQVVLDLTASDSRGRKASAAITLQSQSQQQSLMLRTNRATFKIGDTVRLEAISTKPRGAVYIDLVKNGQTLLTSAIETSGGHGELSVNITPDMFGTIEARAYQITADADPISDRKLIYVDPADDLKVEMTADRESYKPGQDARIDFRTLDSAGRPVSTAIGVQIVDEAVFALSDAQPGFEKVFMYLEKELLTPRYEVHQFTIDRVLMEPDDLPVEAANRERAAEVLFAAAGTVRDRDIHGEFGREAIEAKRQQYAGLYWQRSAEKAQALATEMTSYYAAHRPSAEGFDRDLQRLAEQGPAERKLLDDMWGHRFVGSGQFNRSGYSYLTLRSAGPDGRDGTPDDLTIAVYAHQEDASRQAAVNFHGNVSKQAEVVAGGRAAIQGRITDEKGNGVGAVKVSARRRSNGRIVSVYTDSTGRFAISDLAPGAYEVNFESDPYRPMSYRKLVIDSGERATLDARLDVPGGMPISLTVYGYTRFGKGEANFMALDGPMPGGVAGGVPGGRVRGEPLAARQKVAVAAMAPATVAAQNAALPPLEKDKEERDEKKAGGADDAGGAGGAGPRVRSFFPETLYTNPALITDGQGRASIRVPMADSITTWRISSLASTVGGQLGSATLPIRVFQDFFVDLDLPVSVTEGDVLSVPVAVYNYLPERHQVSLDLRQDPWFALDGDQASKQVEVGAGEVTVAYFRIKAGKIGEQQLQVTARIAGAPAGQPGDAEARVLNVLPNGQEKDVVVNERLEGSASKAVVIPDGAIADASKILVKLYPGALSQVVEGLDSILRMPGGCFEQTSSSTYPDVLVMDYLKTSKKITPEIQAKADGFISLGYQRLVTFEVPGGGFSWFGQAPANKILTAYGLMEFSDMSRIHEVDQRLIERTQNWLASQQQPDGGFKPDTSFINEGATTHYNTDVLRITAYIGWSLAATGYKGQAVEKAKQYCASHATGKEDAYTLAVLANFAADYGRDEGWTGAAVNALAAKATEDDKTAYWKQEAETPTSAREASADLETTALAAQALLKSGQKSSLAKKALDYLTSKKDSLGNWQTTQATILALKAFVLSFSKGTAADTNGSVAVSIDGKEVNRLDITRDNNDLLQVVDLKPYTHTGSNKIDLKFTGRGSMQYQIVGRYYMPWAGEPDAGPKDPLSIQVSYDRTRLAQDEVATARVKVQNNTRAVAKMIMVDLGTPPGFEPSAEDFDNLIKSSEGRPGGKLEKYTITAKQIILYFDGLNPNQRLEFSYKLRAKFPLRARTFSSRVYEYYNPSIENRTKPVEMVVVGK
jgi:uncharacterized protein YfaS (alpha-2-macroglobulin family)